MCTYVLFFAVKIRDLEVIPIWGPVKNKKTSPSIPAANDNTKSHNMYPGAVSSTLSPKYLIYIHLIPKILEILDISLKI